MLCLFTEQERHNRGAFWFLCPWHPLTRVLRSHLFPTFAHEQILSVKETASFLRCPLEA